METPTIKIRLAWDPYEHISPRPVSECLYRQAPHGPHNPKAGQIVPPHSGQVDAEIPLTAWQAYMSARDLVYSYEDRWFHEFKLQEAYDRYHAELFKDVPSGEEEE